MLDGALEAVHFIGIGGVGMSGIAKVAKSQGLQVSGSDMKASRYTIQLNSLGIDVAIGHGPQNIPDGNPTIVVSTAILENNPELLEAKNRGLKIIHRAEMLAYLGRNLETLAVAGTHGKTTTSSMLAFVVDELGLDPTFLIGGTVRKYGSNARHGSGGYYIVEADESDKSFTHLSPAAAIITNIEPDHLDHYDDVQEIYKLFGEFMSSVPENRPLVVCAQDQKLLELAREIRSNDNLITYGTSSECDAQVTEWTQVGVGSTFTVKFKDGTVVNSGIRQNPGIHNVLNGTAVLALIHALGLDVERAARVLRDFSGVRRRFDLVGEAAGITVIDDYAHHPTEIAATIKAATELDFPRVHVLFQPHRYSRASLFTELLHDEFSHAFDAADTVTFMDVYSAGETPVPGVNGQTFMNVVLESDQHPPIEYIPRRIDVPTAMAKKVDVGDLVITMGAGDVTELGKQILHAIVDILPTSSPYSISQKAKIYRDTISLDEARSAN